MKIAYSEEYKVEVISWLQQCRDILVRGGMLQPDPFYERRDLITPAIVDAVIGHIQKTYDNELKNYRTYHDTRNSIGPGQVLVAPKFASQPYEVRLAIVQGVDRIAQKYRAPDEPASPPNLEGPPYIEGEHDSEYYA